MNCLWNILFRKIVFEIFCSGKLSLKYFVQENCLWNILFRKIVFEIFCSGKLSLKYFVQENCLWNILFRKIIFCSWILKYFENFLVKNICIKCSWLNLRFTDWHLYCSIALSVSLDFCDIRSTVWYSLTNPWVDWSIVCLD